jgi:hypothetical protein
MTHTEKLACWKLSRLNNNYAGNLSDLVNNVYNLDRGKKDLFATAIGALGSSGLGGLHAALAGKDFGQGMLLGGLGGLAGSQIGGSLGKILPHYAAGHGVPLGIERTVPLGNSLGLISGSLLASGMASDKKKEEEKRASFQLNLHGLPQDPRLLNKYLPMDSLTYNSDFNPDHPRHDERINRAMALSAAAGEDPPGSLISSHEHQRNARLIGALLGAVSGSGLAQIHGGGMARNLLFPGLGVIGGSKAGGHIATILRRNAMRKLLREAKASY